MILLLYYLLVVSPDQADRLLEVGFKDELEVIIDACPKDRQTMLFSVCPSSAATIVAPFRWPYYAKLCFKFSAV